MTDELNSKINHRTEPLNIEELKEATRTLKEAEGMQEEIREHIKQHFESNFLDGDKMPCKAITFTASGALDVAVYFYELTLQAQKDKIVELIDGQKEVYQAYHEIPESCEVGDEKLHMDSCCNEIIDDIINLINNK